METRYYFIFTAAIILLQLLIYIFNKTLIWWLNKPFSKKTRRAITFTSFLLPNVLVICHFLKLFTVFRLIAL
ncbi:MAG: metallophosphoesterase, partial [Haemophilus parainfluenzae]|nr:metallophosphoesterase [Haemophilus parainfluenzae]